MSLTRATAVLACVALGLGLAVSSARADDEDDDVPPKSAPRTRAADRENADPDEREEHLDDEASAKPWAPPPAPVKNPTTGGLRTGLYADGDQTYVFRGLAALAQAFGHFTLSLGASVDVVSSASVDVRSSPGLSKVDVVTSASGSTSTSGGKMTDRRLAANLGGGWKDNSGHAISGSLSIANERDYNSVGAGLNGSYDLFHRATTLLGGVSFTRNWIASVLDTTFARQSYDVGWTVGVAQVLSRNDALRLRYDGTAAVGYQGSPYRYVRFGDWRAGTGAYGKITFSNTIGSSDGVAENVPELRIRHALVGEWVHAFTEGLGLYSQARLGTDNWGVKNLTAAVELRAATTNWRFRLGYRFYVQSDADFYQSKYVLASSNYTYFTSDKELSREMGNGGSLGIARVLAKPSRPGGPRLLLDLSVNVLHYSYPNFALLPSRTSGVVDVGLTWEL